MERVNTGLQNVIQLYDTVMRVVLSYDKALAQVVSDRQDDKRDGADGGIGIKVAAIGAECTQEEEVREWDRLKE